MADQFLFEINARNNQPHNLLPVRETVRVLYESCQRLVWKHLKNSTQAQYEFLFTTYLLPGWSDVRLRELKTMELQEFFNSFHPRLAAKILLSLPDIRRMIDALPEPSKSIVTLIVFASLRV